MPLNAFPAPAQGWPVDGFHAAEPDWNQEVMHFGARHMALRDGMRLQPEPLLHLGLTNGDLANPLGYMGLYAAGNPAMMHNQSGNFVQGLAAGGAAQALGLMALVRVLSTSP